MKTFITSYSDWLEEYKKDKYKTWIRAILNNDSEIYLKDYDEWLELKQHCEEKKLCIQKIGLQYRSHSIEIDTSNSDGVYLAKSILGSFGQQAKQTFTVGILKDNIVNKTTWLIPELTQEMSSKDSIENCFAEALIYHYAKEK